jgi:hypothetical protein
VGYRLVQHRNTSRRSGEALLVHGAAVVPAPEEHSWYEWTEAAASILASIAVFFAAIWTCIVYIVRERKKLLDADAEHERELTEVQSDLEAIGDILTRYDGEALEATDKKLQSELDQFKGEMRAKLNTISQRLDHLQAKRTSR